MLISINIPPYMQRNVPKGGSRGSPHEACLIEREKMDITVEFYAPSCNYCNDAWLKRTVTWRAWHGPEDHGSLPQGGGIWTGVQLEGQIQESSKEREGTREATERKDSGASSRKSREVHVWAQISREYCLDGSQGTETSRGQITST